MKFCTKFVEIILMYDKTREGDTRKFTIYNDNSNKRFVKPYMMKLHFDKE